jgi:methylated-DNA-[protein]-cysteine S-methyltransferase
MSRRIEGQIGLTTCQTAYGWVGIAWSERSLVALSLPQATEAEAMGQLPAGGGTAPAATPGLDVAALVEKLQAYFDGEAVDFDEPLDKSIGTEFQRRVWAITRAIPRGQTRTYGQIARQAGSPGAARAVGQSMARNPWPIVVPCHRVVGSDGSLTGFGGGVEMKHRMLAMEGARLDLPGLP